MLKRVANFLFTAFIFAATITCGSNIDNFNPQDYLGKSVPGEYLHVHSPPDPVNPRTGNFYLPIQDLYLPCFGFPLEVFRAYNSFSRRDGAFGIGWTFNYDIKINIGGFGSLKVVESDGFVNEYDPEIKADEDRGPVIEKIAEAKKIEDKRYRKKGRSDAFYDKLRIKLSTDKEYFKRMRSRYIRERDKEVADGKYISTMRGYSEVIKSKKAYTRIRRNGTRETYDKKGYLVNVEDRNKNRLYFSRNSSGQLIRVSDGCKHFINMQYNKNGHISQITDSLTRIMRYSYDKAGHLIKSVDSIGNAVFYSYNKTGLMNKITYDKGKIATIKYDKKGRVTEQAGPGKKTTKYRYKKRGKNYIATTVKDTEGYYEKFIYIKTDNKTIRKDKKGNQQVTVISRSCSKPVSIGDGKGKGESYEYDENAQLVSRKDALDNTYTYKYDSRFVDHVTEIKEKKGQKTTFLYDPRGNLTYANIDKKGWIKIRYENHGKIKSMSDSMGNLISFTYNYFGKPTQIQKKFKNKIVSTIFVKYKRSGELDETRYKPDDIAVVNDLQKTLNSMLQMLKPAGIDFSI